MAALDELAERLEREADPASPFLPKGADPDHRQGQRRHGAATSWPASASSSSTCARRRAWIARGPGRLLRPGRALDAAIKARAPGRRRHGRAARRRAAAARRRRGAAEAFARRLAGDNGPARAVSFASEAGQFQGAGYRWSSAARAPSTRPTSRRICRGRPDGARRGLHGPARSEATGRRVCKLRASAQPAASPHARRDRRRLSLRARAASARRRIAGIADGVEHIAHEAVAADALDRALGEQGAEGRRRRAPPGRPAAGARSASRACKLRLARRAWANLFHGQTARQSSQP